MGLATIEILILSTFVRTEKCQFLGRGAKIDIFQRGLTPLFFIESCSTKAQIDRLDERNRLAFSELKYLDK